MMSRIIAIVNHKGGVGKTTTTFSLGKALSLRGKKVLIVDNDPQSNLTQYSGLKNIEKSIYDAICHAEKLPIYPIGDNFDIVPSDLGFSKAEYELQTDQVNGFFRLKDALEDLQFYDYILIDCPPSLGILTMNALIAANGVQIVMESEYFSMKGLQTVLDLVSSIKKRLNPNLEVEGLLLTKVNNTVFKLKVVDTIRQSYKEKVYQTLIRQNIALTEVPSQGIDIFSYAPQSHGAEDYMNLAIEILEQHG